MNVNNLKKSQKRFNVKYLQKLNLQGYGEYNLYPQEVAALIGSSSVGGTCLDRYATFIEGNGFDSQEFSDFVCNRFGDTIDDILHLVALDMAKFHGFALHVNYDALGRICELQHVHFEDTRLEEEDDNGYVAHIAIHPDWTGQKTRSGKTIKINEENVKKIFPFNPRPDVVMNQIAYSGGIENYRGQILWYSWDGRYQYPKPIYDKVATALSTDEGIDNVLYRNARNNFIPAGALIHRKGTLIGMDEDGNPIEPNERDEKFGEGLNVFLGDENAASVMDITYETEEDKPEFIAFRGNNFDKDFTVTDERTTAKIYAAFQQECFYLLSKGKIGFGGTVIKDAYDLYNSIVQPKRAAIQREFAAIFKHWIQEEMPQNVGKYEIQPLVLKIETEQNIQEIQYQEVNE